MAKIYLKKVTGSSDSITVASAAEVFGGVGGQEELIIIPNGTSFPTGIVVEQTVEKVTLSGALSDYTFAKSGSTDVLVYRSGSLVATIRPQTDDDVGNDGTALAFTSGAVLSTTLYVVSASEVRIGGVGGQVLTVTTAAYVPDTTPPTAPSFALATDSGTNTADGITNVGTVNVTGLETGATWVYSTNGGTDWSAGAGTSFTLAEGTYAAGSIQVKQTDAAGNAQTVAAATNAVAITVDTTAPTVTALTQTRKTLTITAEAGSTLTILDGTTDVTAKFDVTEASGIFTAVAKADAFTGTETLSLSAKATDTAGNVGTAFATPVTGAIDTTAPTVTALTQSGKTLTITAEAGSTLTILDGTTDVTAKFTVTEASGIFTAVAKADAFTGTETLSLSAKATDTAGNVGTAFATPVTGAIDTTAPAAPTFALATDSGTNTGDGITNVGTVNVTGLEVGATWEYSTNGGTDWSAGTGTSFTLAEANYVIDAVKVRQSDAVGNVSTPASNAAAITVDTTAPAAPSFELATDSGTNTGDGITNVGTVNVTGLETGATWVYSTNGGTDWSAGAGTSFTLAEGTYAAGSIQVKQTDAAGNAQTVAAASNAAAITVDTTAPAAATTEVTYTNGSSGDGAIHFEDGDTITLNFSELLASITSVTITNTHITGAASFVLDAPASTASVVLDSTSTLAATDTITLVGVDLAGNSASMIFTLA